MFHKVFVIFGLNWISFSNGFAYGHTTSVISALMKREEGIDLTEGQISLIATTPIAIASFGYGLAAAITDKLGGRWAFTLFSIPTMFNFIILYQATEMYQFMLSRVILGISLNALIILNVFVTAEYMRPKTRGFFLNMVTTAAPAIGSALVHGLGIVLHWRTVSLMAAFVAGVGIVLPYFWVESPHWLASKGKFAECDTAFKTLHGTKPNSERELQLLIRLQTSKLKTAADTKRITTMKRLSVAVRSKYFWGLILLCEICNVYYTAGGKFVFSILATVILEEITGTSDILLFTLFVVSFFVVGSLLSCLLIRKTSMRTLLFSTGSIDCVVLLLFSVSLYLNNGQAYFSWINVALLSLYFIIANAGPCPVIEAIYSEIFPLELKVYMFFISSFVLTAGLSLSIMLLPYMVRAMGYHGLFLMNTAIMAACLVYVWFKLPETKFKTLQEIEMYFKTNNFNIEEELNKDQTDNFI